MREVEDRIQLAHGGGGRLTRELIEQEILPRFGDGPLAGLPDGALLPRPAADLVFTTDGYVVQPLVFPGGTIGHLAVHGTVNDVAVCGARPLYLSLGMIVEEGLPLATLRLVLDAVRESARECGVMVVTGDTKVVPRGQCDGLYLHSAGIGERYAELSPSADRVQPGDCVLVSGPLAQHGFAVLHAREMLQPTDGPVSDTAPVHRLVQACRPWGRQVHFMRDPTRGGLAATLNEVADGRPLSIELRECDLPFTADVRALSELLGIDPLTVASEGRLVLFCAPGCADELLAAWRALPEGRDSCCVGEVQSGPGRVVLQTLVGACRLVDLPRGELLPRIC